MNRHLNGILEFFFAFGNKTGDLRKSPVFYYQSKSTADSKTRTSLCCIKFEPL